MNRPPAVWIWKLRSVLDSTFQSVLWGLEEEGIPFEMREVNGGASVDLAKLAADGSPLGVGIGLGERGEVVLHHHDLPTGTPLFILPGELWRAAALRHLGMNAGRLVKGQPLIIDHNGDAAGSPEGCGGTRRVASEVLIELILEELFSELNGENR